MPLAFFSFCRIEPPQTDRKMCHCYSCTAVRTIVGRRNLVKIYMCYSRFSPGMFDTDIVRGGMIKPTILRLAAVYWIKYMPNVLLLIPKKHLSVLDILLQPYKSNSAVLQENTACAGWSHWYIYIYICQYQSKCDNKWSGNCSLDQIMHISVWLYMAVGLRLHVSTCTCYVPFTPS